MNFIFIVLFFKEKKKKNWYQVVTRKWHDLQEKKNFPGEYFLSPQHPWGKKVEN